MEVSKEDDNKIWYLFYEKGYNIEEIVVKMGNKFTYQQIRDIIHRRYK